MSKRSQKNSLRLEVIIIVLVVLLIFFAINYFKGNISSDAQPKLDLNGQFCMHTIDVGQGDSILITEGEHAILIDAGPGSSEDALLKYLKRAGVKKFDYVIATHPHEDHIGGMDKILENYKVDNFIMTDLPKNMIPNTSCYEKMIDLLIDKKEHDVLALKFVESNSIRLDKTRNSETNNIINSIMPFDTENCIQYQSNYLIG